MTKAETLSSLTAELKKCGETLIKISKHLSENLSGTTDCTLEKKKGKPEKKESSPMSLEEVRAVLAEASRSGYTSQIKELLKEHGGDKLSEINPAEYESLLKEVEEIQNAG